MMNRSRYEINDPTLLQSIFTNIFESEVTATSIQFGATPKMRYLSPLLTIIWGEYSRFCGRWMSQGVYITLSVDQISFLINGHEVSNLKNPLEVSISLPNTEYDYSFLSDYKALALFINSDLLKPIFESLLDKDYDEGLKSMMCFKSQEDKDRLLSMLLPLTYLNKESSISAALHSHQVSQEIVERVLLSLDYGKEVNYERTYCHYLAIQAHRLLLAKRHRALSMTELCKQLKASARSIQKGFKASYGMGVIEYHKIYRLLHVRKFLQRNGTKEVGKVIKSFGFYHIGRFAASYRQAFGLNPSEEP